jgi:hypothetical protein
MPEVAEVLTLKPTRQMLAETACEGRVHDGSALGNCSVVLAATNSVNEMFVCGMWSLVATEVHCSEKPFEARG